MPAYTNDLRLKEIATGDESGTWGDSTNTNLELIAEAFSFGTEAITTNADTHPTTIADGATDEGRSIYLKYTGTLDSACTITLGPNTVSKLWFIENGTSGSQNIIISQGSGANVTIPAGDVKAVYSDGAGSGAAIVDAFTDLNLAGTTTIDVLSASGNATIGGTLGVTGAVTANAGVVVDNITIDGTEIDLSSGDLTIDVAGGIVLDADDNGTTSFKDGGTRYGLIEKSSNDMIIQSAISDGDMLLRGNDGGATIAALTLDMSDAGSAYFNNKVGIGTSSPANNVHIEIDAGGEGILVKGTGDHSGLLQFNVNRSNSNRVLGQLLGTWNGTDVADIQLKTADDTTNKDNGQITFSTSTADNLSEKMRLTSDGKLGIGETDPTSILHLKNSASDGVAGISMENDARRYAINVHGGLSDGLAIFDAGASATRVFLASTGRVGIGNDLTSPNAGLSVSNADIRCTGAAVANDANSISMAQESIGGAITCRGPSTSERGKFTAGVSRSNGAAFLGQIHIMNGGNVNFGGHTTEASGTTGGITMSVDSNDRMNLICATTTTGGVEVVEFRNPNSTVGDILTNGTSTQFRTSSDYRLKENIEPLPNGLERLKQLNPVKFDWKTDGTSSEGFIAHEVEEIFADCVAGEKDGEKMQGMDYGRITPLLVKAIQEQQTQIEALQSEIKTLKGE